jgi:hypothetical protein
MISEQIDQMTRPQVAVVQGLLLARNFGQVSKLVGSDGRPDGLAGPGTHAALEQARDELTTGGRAGEVDANLVTALLSPA